MVKTKLQLRVTRHFISDRPEEKEDILVDEHPFSIILDGKKRFEGVITPGRFREFAVGFLFTRGLIRGMGDLECLEIEEDRVVAKSWTKNCPGP